MEFTFAAQRQLSFIVSVGGRNRLVAFGNRNQAGVAIFMTSDEKVANVIRRHSLSRRGVIQETTVKRVENNGEDAAKVHGAPKPAVKTTGTVAKAAPTAAKPAPKPVSTDAEPKERTFDNYTVARETICKELGIKKGDVRNPNTLAQVAKEHGIIIKYKEL